jgi:hypothetical protein
MAETDDPTKTKSMLILKGFYEEGGGAARQD